MAVSGPLAISLSVRAICLPISSSRMYRSIPDRFIKPAVTLANGGHAFLLEHRLQLLYESVFVFAGRPEGHEVYRPAGGLVLGSAALHARNSVMRAGPKREVQRAPAGPVGAA